jgi:hypothetical protein
LFPRWSISLFPRWNFYMHHLVFFLLAGYPMCHWLIDWLAHWLHKADDKVILSEGFHCTLTNSTISDFV